MVNGPKLSRVKLLKILLILGFSFSIIIRIFLIMTGMEVADIVKLKEMGEAILNLQNPYRLISYNIYPPIALYLEAFSLYLANNLGLPFHIVTKILPNIADFGIAFVIYKFLTKMKASSRVSYFWALIYVLNPLTIIISASHGQIDSIPSFLVLTSSYLLYYLPKRFYLPPLLLGLAITIKPNPAILLPSFLIFTIKKEDLFKKFIFLSLTLVIVIYTFIPYILKDLKVISNILGYSGSYDIGIAAILRGIFYQDNAGIWFAKSQEISDASKIAFMAGLLFLNIVFINSKELIKSLLTVYLLFLSIYFGISVQYLIWILPFALVEREKMVFPYIITGTIALVGFYLFFGPEILLGGLGNLDNFQSRFMPIYFFGNILVWLTLVYWLYQIIINYLKKSFSQFNFWHKSLIIGSFIIFMILLVPYLNLLWLSIP